MYLVRCGYCGSTYETESEGKLNCKNCGAVNNLEDIVKKTSGNYFKQAAEQDYDEGQKRKIHKPKSELEKVNIMRKDQKLALRMMLKMTLVVMIIFIALVLMIR